MPACIPRSTIVLLAFVSVILQGPIICALYCLGAHGASSAATDMHAHMSLPSSADFGASHLMALSAPSGPGSMDGCHSLDYQGAQMAQVSLVDPGVRDTLFSRADSVDPPNWAARFTAEARAAPSEFIAHPPERPPTV